MKELTIQKITTADSKCLDVLSDLAASIWREHFVSIISSEQIEYMLTNFQSKEAMARQIMHEGYIYYLVFDKDEPVGYTGILLKKEEYSIFLSKIYIKKEHRGKGIAKKLISNFLADQNDYPYKKIYLTCNKQNASSIVAYRKMGFTITGDVVKSIGNGMVMDDYVMTLELQ